MSTSQSADSRVLRLGFIGLGLMGQAFVGRLIELGHTPSVYDIDTARAEQAGRLGAVPLASAAQVAANSDIVLLCVTSTAAVHDVVFGDGGIAEADRPAATLVDHSTTELGSTRAMAARLTQTTGTGWVDAPVSGGPAAARGGTLSIMAGGDAEHIERVSALMHSLGSSFTHFGAVGAGQVAKMVNQVLVLNNYCVLAEALTLAEAGGIDASKLPQALAAGHAGSNLLQSLFPRMIARDFEPSGYARQVLKDLDMVNDLSRQLGVPAPMSTQAASLFRLLNAKGHAELDGIAVLKLLDPNDSV